jgi:hypothetical protein
MKKSTTFVMLSMMLLAVAASVVSTTQNGYSLAGTSLSAMILVSFGNENSSDVANPQPTENKTVTYFGQNTQVI